MKDLKPTVPVSIESRDIRVGTVIRTESGYHRVLADGQTVVCRAPKKLLNKERTATTAVVIGDRVRILVFRDGTGLIEEVLTRENELVRGSAGGGRFLDVIAANLDLLVVVQSLRQPDLDPARVDRFLLISEAAEIPAALCLNKLDISSPGEAEAAASLYRSAGYRVIITCAKTEQGIEELREVIEGKTTALLGPSGVGKSSLLNDLQPGLSLRTREVSEGTGTGRHTTTTAELLALTGGGWVADTPGLGELTIREVEPEDAAWLFPEFRTYSAACRYSNCTHGSENGCAVVRALSQGELATSRYHSYQRVFEELRERARNWD